MFKIGEFNRLAREAGMRTIAQQLRDERHAEKHYFEGKPCKVCGETLRYKSNKRCVTCKQWLDAQNYQQRKARKAIADQWRQDARYGHTVSLQPAYFVEQGMSEGEAIAAAFRAV